MKPHVRRVVHTSPTLSPLSRKVARLFCVLSMSCTRIRSGLLVSAFRLDHSLRQPRIDECRLGRLRLSKNVHIPMRPMRTSQCSKQCVHKGNDHRKFHNPLFASNSDGESDMPSENDSSERGMKKSSMKRVGGRRRKEKRQQDNFPPVENKLPPANLLVVALLVLTLLKNLLFGGVDSSDNYYYYSYSSSSVYETRLNPDGSRTTTETSRKESSDLKTNIPGLTDKDFLDRSNNRNRVLNNYFYFEE